MSYRDDADRAPLINLREQFAADLFDVALRIEALATRLATMSATATPPHRVPWVQVAVLTAAAASVRGVMVAVKRG